MIEDDDVLMMSLTDALTCVLAASIALFLIFVVFIKLVPSAATGMGSASASRMRDAVAADLRSGDSTALLRIASRDCAAIEALQVGDNDNDAWLIRNDKSGAFCARLVRLRTGLTKPFYVVASSLPDAPVSMYLEVGSEGWPLSAALGLDDKRYVACPGGQVVLAMVRNDSEYIAAPTNAGCR